MSAWRTAFAAMLGLGLLEAVVSSDQSAGRVGDFLQGVGTVVEHVLSPTVPAIPDLRKHGGAAPTSTTSTPSGSLLPPDWTTSPTAPSPPAPAAPTQMYA